MNNIESSQRLKELIPICEIISGGLNRAEKQEYRLKNFLFFKKILKRPIFVINIITIGNSNERPLDNNKNIVNSCTLNILTLVRLITKKHHKIFKSNKKTPN